MTSYIEFVLHGRNFRYYNVDRIDIEKITKKKSYWKRVGIYNEGLYKRFDFRANKKTIKMLLHRVIYYVYNQEWDIYDISPDNKIDHIKHEECIPLDNSISNLRVVNAQQNSFNRNSKGYSYNIDSNKYRARIQIDGDNLHLGFYETEQEAREAYLFAKQKFHKIPI